MGTLTRLSGVRRDKATRRRSGRGRLAVMESVERRVLLAGAPLLEAGVLIQDGAVPLALSGNASPDVVDWNGNGKKDLMVGESSAGNVQFFANTGTDASPLFAGGVLVTADGVAITTSTGFRSGSTPQAVDWNNDGFLDLITGEANGSVRVYPGSVAGLTDYTAVQAGGWDFTALGGSSKPEVADWNNDGAKDLLVGNGYGTIDLLLNTGTDASPSFTTSQTVLAGLADLSVGFNGVASPVVVDWNRDGKKDLIVGNRNGDLRFYANIGTDGAPDFSATSEQLMAAGVAVGVGTYSRPVVSDWDNDGTPDIICGNGNGRVYYYHGVEPPALTSDDEAVVEGDPAEGEAETTELLFTATLPAPAVQAVTVRYTTADGTATAADNDYLPTAGTLLIPAGERTGTISVLIVKDTVAEADETFYIDLFDANGAAPAKARLTGTITNDDVPTVTIQDVTLAEGNSGTTSFVFTVALSSVFAKDVTVDYATADGTATVGVGDYTAASGSVTILAGQASGTATVLVNGDTINESDESFSVLLSNPTNATLDLAKNTATGTIVNEDWPALSIDDVSRIEGDSGITTFVFTVSLSEAIGVPVTVRYLSADGTATLAEGDYRRSGGWLTIPAGQTSGTVLAAAVGDTVGEPDEVFYVNLSGATYASIARATGKGTILNDDPILSPQMRVAVSWPREFKARIWRGQARAVDFGSVAVGAEAPVRVFTIRNTGNADLKLSKLQWPGRFRLVERLPRKLAPGESATFGLAMGTAKAGGYGGYVQFSTNVIGEKRFYFPVSGAVVKEGKAVGAKKQAAEAVVAVKRSWAGLFSTGPSKPAGANDLLAGEAALL